MCPVDGCTRKPTSGTPGAVCPMHYERMRRTGAYGEGTARYADRGREHDHHRFKGEHALYKSIHRRMVRTLGSARAFGCIAPGCESAAREWAYDHGDPQEFQSSDGWPVSVNPFHYQPMCARHHHARDHAFRRAEREAAAANEVWLVPQLAAELGVAANPADR